MRSGKSAKNELKPTVLHLRHDSDEEHGRTIAFMVSIDPRRIEKGNGPLEDEGAFSVHYWMEPSAFARILSQMITFATLASDEDVTIEIGEEWS
jgi:hypothetical protein